MNTVISTWPIGNTDRSVTAAPAAHASLLSRVGTGLWRALEAAGRARGHRELLALADQCEAQQPALARELRAACRQGPVA
jgi:hypothetical protein